MIYPTHVFYLCIVSIGRRRLQYYHVFSIESSYSIIWLAMFENWKIMLTFLHHFLGNNHNRYSIMIMVISIEEVVNELNEWNSYLMFLS